MSDTRSMDNLFAAIDIITNKRLQNLGFDRTVRAKILDNSQASKGLYTVSEVGNASFLSSYEAYSENQTYEIGTDVQVTIPSNDYNQTKIIVGKYIADINDSYTTYVNPLEQYLDITGNIINASGSSKWSIAANNPNEDIVPVWQSADNLGIKGYDRLCLSGSFLTLLNDLEIVGGTYGLVLNVIGKENGFIHYNNYQLLSFDMFGNPYNYTSYTNQVAVFDVSDISEIVQVSLYLVQNNDFYTLDRGYWEYKPEGGDNIFLEIPYISLGYDLSEVREDQVSLYTYDDTEYDGSAPDSVQKTMSLRWIHMIKEDRAAAINENHTLLTSGEGVIRWYEYLPDKNENTIAGKYWSEIPEAKNKLEYMFWTAQDPAIVNQKFMVVCECPSKEYVNTNIINQAGGLYQSCSGVFREEINGITIGEVIENALTDQSRSMQEYRNQLENMNAASPASFQGKYSDLIKLLNEITDSKTTIKYYKSDILTFTNATYNPLDYIDMLVQELQIKVDPKGLRGSYMIYDDAGIIKNPEDADTHRYFEATYKSLVTGNLKLDVKSAESIFWYIPLASTMIEPPQDGIEYNSRDDIYTTISIDESVELGLSPGEYAKIQRAPLQGITGDTGSFVERMTQQVFRIKKFYTPMDYNNTVYCKIIRESKVYTAQATMTFGISGTNGTDATFILLMREVDNAGNITDIPTNALTMGGKQIGIVPKFYNYENLEISDYFATHPVRYTWYTSNQYFDGEQDEANAWVTATMNQNEAVKIQGIKTAAGNDIGTALNASGEVKLESFGSNINSGKFDFYILRASVNYSQAIDYEEYTEEEIEQVLNYSYTGEKLTSEEQQNILAGKCLAGQRRLDENGNPICKGYRDVTLDTYLPIPVRAAATDVGLTGSTKIVYDVTGGNPAYYKDKFYLTPNNDVTWTSACKATQTAVKNSITNIKNIGNLLMYYPRFNEETQMLTPAAMFAMNGCDRRYCIIAKRGNNVVWTQPILIIQNRYSSAMLNAWDGSLTIDEKNGTILATMVGAGIKEKDNTFSGVLMGDIDAGAKFNAENKSGIGIYGFNHGDQSYNFNIDGTAFIGKAGHGRINFDGNSGEIKSGSYTLSDGQMGMKIDLDGDDNISAGLEMFGPGGSVVIYTNQESKIDDKLTDAQRQDLVDGKSAIYFSGQRQFLKSLNYNGKYGKDTNAYYPTGKPGEVFPPSGEDNISASTGTFFDLYNGWIDTRNGIIGGWKITAHGIEALNGTAELSDEGIIRLGKVITDSTTGNEIARGRLFLAEYELIGNTDTKNYSFTEYSGSEKFEISSSNYDPYSSGYNFTTDSEDPTQSKDSNGFTKVEFSIATSASVELTAVAQDSWTLRDGRLSNLGVELKCVQGQNGNKLQKIITWCPTGDGSGIYSFLGTRTAPWYSVYSSNGFYFYEEQFRDNANGGWNLVASQFWVASVVDLINTRMREIHNLAVQANNNALSAIYNIRQIIIKTYGNDFANYKPDEAREDGGDTAGSSLKTTGTIKARVDDLETQISSLKSSLKEANKAIEQLQKDTETVVKDYPTHVHKYYNDTVTLDTNTVSGSSSHAHSIPDGGSTESATVSISVTVPKITVSKANIETTGGPTK